MRRSLRGARAQGAALIVATIVLVLVSAAALLEQARQRSPAAREEATARALDRARQALLAWAVSQRPRGASRGTPGLLPFPDRARDGNYDGHGDCVAPKFLREAHLLGRFPSAGHTAASGPCPAAPLYVDVRDAAGEPLWYAVSRNLVGAGGAERINPELGEPGRAPYPWLRVVAADGAPLRDPLSGRPLAVAAVVIAPGAALPGQDRRAPAPPAQAFLDRIDIAGTRFDNADADGCADAAAAPCAGALAGEEFVASDAPPGAAFNDRLALITADELLRAVETRVLGEVELALEAYRERSGTFPWLAPFRAPRGLAAGVVESSSAGFLRGSVADHARAGVHAGDIVVDLGDGDRGTVIGIAGAELRHHGLSGGDGALVAGDAYRVLPAYRAVPGVRAGLLPVHLPDELFRSALAARWRFVDATPSVASDFAGDASLVPPLADLMAGDVEVTADSGWCVWQRPERATCVGGVEGDHFRADLGVTVTRRLELSFDFAGEVSVHPPTATDVRRRSVRANPLAPGRLETVAPLPAPLLPRARWSVRITDASGARWGRRAVAIDADTRAQVALEGIVYDLSVVYDDADTPADELPEWLVKNAWHELVHVALSAAAAPGGSGTCTPGADCLSLLAGAGVAFDNEVNALLISAGREWSVAAGTDPSALQSRDAGIGDCDWDTVPDEARRFLCAYLEGENNGGDTDVFAREVVGYGLGAPSSLPFNDQVRVIDPPPPGLAP